MTMRSRDRAPVTQLARELAVSVVDTPGVLHMFVAVVAVGEHFAAVLTLIAVASCLSLRLAHTLQT